MKELSEFNDHFTALTIDGIQYANGSVDRFEVIHHWDFKPARYEVNFIEKILIKEQKEKDLFWNECGKLVEIISRDNNVLAYAGDGDSGGDGFVSVLTLDTREIIWLAFFESSNPFSELSIQGDNIIALSTLGFEWVFPIKSPKDFKVMNIGG